MPRLPALPALALFITAVAPLHAQPQVRVLETWPHGDDVVLARNQNFYLRIAHAGDTPVHIWARPYFQGELAPAGSNPSATYVGTGEALGWFFLMDPAGEVDEVRIEVGDGSRAGTQVAARWNGRVRSGDGVATDPEPAWVATLKAQAQEALQREHAAREAARTPATDAADGMLLAAFMFAVAASAIGGIAATAWATLRWRRGWRIAAAVPATGLALVLLRILVDTARDPSSHNLWPFEIACAGTLALLAIGALALARAVATRRAVTRAGSAR